MTFQNEKFLLFFPMGQANMAIFDTVEQAKEFADNIVQECPYMNQESVWTNSVGDCWEREVHHPSPSGVKSREVWEITPVAYNPKDVNEAM